MDSKHFIMLSELFEQFRTQALMLLKDAEENGYLDELTGCYNRKAYELRKEQFFKMPIGVIYVDVNGLKLVNDTQGHEAGDILIKDLGKMLKAYFGGNDVFRVGGDEFVILKQAVKPETFSLMIDEFRIAVDTNRKTNVAIGYSMGADLETAIKSAEAQMYFNKKKFYEEYPNLKRIK